MDMFCGPIIVEPYRDQTPRVGNRGAVFGGGAQRREIFRARNAAPRHVSQLRRGDRGHGQHRRQLHRVPGPVHGGQHNRRTGERKLRIEVL